MNVNDMTRKQFEDLPRREDWSKDVKCDSIIILPMRRKHDSGYRCMDFIAVNGDKPVCRLSGCSDVIHIEGIGGYGYEWLKRYGKVPDSIVPAQWSIDCLPKSGLLRMWCRFKIVAGASLSSFEIYSKDASSTLT